MNYVEEWKKLAEGLDDSDAPPPLDLIDSVQPTIVHIQVPPPCSQSPSPIWAFISAALIGIIAFQILGAIAH